MLHVFQLTFSNYLNKRKQTAYTCTNSLIDVVQSQESHNTDAHFHS